MTELRKCLAPGGPLHALSKYKQFILWKAVPKANGKTTKLPISPHTMQVHGADDATQYLDCETAITISESTKGKLHLAFVFTEDDPFFFVDIDDSLQDDGTWSPIVQELCSTFPGVAGEVSQSGKAIHLFGTAEVTKERKKKAGVLFDIYTEKRFVALTGKNTVGDASIDHTEAMKGVVEKWLKGSSGSADNEDWTTEPVAGWTGKALSTDEAIIKKASESESSAGVFGGRASFKDLWEKNEVKLSEFYPDDQGINPYDASAVDAALAQHLAFWTGKNCERIQTIMMKSGLVRDKYDREDYLVRTILNAVSMQKDVYSAGDLDYSTVKAVEPKSINTSVITPEILSVQQFLGAEQKIEHFRGCVYVRNRHRILTPDGSLLKPDTFKAVYGGYIFAMDCSAAKTTKNAWEAFTESRAVRFPKVADTIFMPAQPAGHITDWEGDQVVNSYVPLNRKKVTGDPTRFLIHLEKLLPVQKDREILLAYMAACVQHKGVKFQWAPLLQGVEGNGKTLFTRCVAHAVGMKYTHFPKADELANKFNNWMRDKLFIGVEDVYLADKKSDVMESLKPLITNDWIPLEPKGGEQETAYVCANFILNSNHKDALRKTENDRRYAVFYTSQQKKKDLEAAGMGNGYFRDIYKWLRLEGYDIVSTYLEEYEIPEALNPANGFSAPKTSSTEEAIFSSMGSIEHEILEAVEEGRRGFAGGWISSTALAQFLEENRMSRAIPVNKRKDMLDALGYEYHPAFKDGRSNSGISIDGGVKSRLFIEKGHMQRNIISPSQAVNAYIAAQSGEQDTSKVVELFK